MLSVLPNFNPKFPQSLPALTIVVFAHTGVAAKTNGLNLIKCYPVHEEEDQYFDSTYAIGDVPDDTRIDFQISSFTKISI